MAADVGSGTVLWAAVLLHAPALAPFPAPMRWINVVLGGTVILVTLFVGGSAAVVGTSARPCTHAAWVVDVAALVIATCAFGCVVASWQCGMRRITNNANIVATNSKSRLFGKSAGVSPVSNGSSDSGIRRSPLEGVMTATTSTPMPAGPSKPLRLLIPPGAMSAKSPCANAEDTSWVLVPETAPAYPYAAGARIALPDDINTPVKGGNDSRELVNISLNTSSVDPDARSISAKSVLSASVQYAGDLDGATVSPVAASPAAHSAHSASG